MDLAGQLTTPARAPRLGRQLHLPQSRLFPEDARVASLPTGDVRLVMIRQAGARGGGGRLRVALGGKASMAFDIAK